MYIFGYIELELGEIFELKNGYTPSKSNPEYWLNGNINWFKIEDINTNGRILKNSIEKVNKEIFLYPPFCGLVVIRYEAIRLGLS